MSLSLNVPQENNKCSAHSGTALFKKIWSQMRRSFGGGAQTSKYGNPIWVNLSRGSWLFTHLT
jgi:hypothetical protein